MRVSATGFGAGGVVEKESIAVAEIAALRRSSAVVWVDVTGTSDVAMMRALGEEFEIHRLALADVVNVNQRAKVEDYDEHAFIVLRMVDPTHVTETEQFAMFIGGNYVLTFQERAGDCFGMVRQRLRDAAGQLRKRGSDYFAYALLDSVVDAYFPIIEGLDARLEAIELAILEGKAAGNTVAELHSVRRCLLELRRAVWPLREVTSGLVRGEQKHFSSEVHPYLRDVHDHVVQLLDLLENYREMTNSLLDLYLSSANQRLNEVIKLLTVISTIFIPLTFIVGVYGMNFDNIPGLGWRFGYAFAFGLMGVVGVVLASMFRRRGWL